jgi:5-carboxymethyl-2-hydroxymuconate isomerase
MAARAHFEHLLQTEHIGVTVQVDEGQEAFDEKHSSIHPLFKKA